MLIKREDVVVARIFMVISIVNPNICGIIGQIYLEQRRALSSFMLELMLDICEK